MRRNALTASRWVLVWLLLFAPACADIWGFTDLRERDPRDASSVFSEASDDAAGGDDAATDSDSSPNDATPNEAALDAGDADGVPGDGPPNDGPQSDDGPSGGDGSDGAPPTRCATTDLTPPTVDNSMVVCSVLAPHGAGNPSLSVIHDGVFPPPTADSGQEYDTYTGTPSTEAFVGYSYAMPQTFGSIIFQQGIEFSDGGWFVSVGVQVLQNGVWVPVPGVAFTPLYGGNDGLSFQIYSITFPAVSGTGIRLDGVPGGANTFISIGELRVCSAQ